MSITILKHIQISKFNITKSIYRFFIHKNGKKRHNQTNDHKRNPDKTLREKTKNQILNRRAVKPQMIITLDENSISPKHEAA